MIGRLIITKVELENFKSYAGVKVIGPFHSSFSAVVGPNGSGKSNLLESLLFTFGKRAKKMRLNKLAELIHKSKKFPDLNFARVTVFFEENDEDCRTILGTQFSVSRVVYRNNVSNYKVNNKDSTYEDVTVLLKEKGIDLEHNRFLILQGEVEQIALMKPKAGEEGKSGLLEYLEEIIGSDKYIPKILQIEKELESIADDLTLHKKLADQATDSISSIAAEVRSASEFIFIHKQLSQLHNLKYHIKLVKNSQNFYEKDQEYNNICHIIDKLKQELKQETGNDSKNSDFIENKIKDLFALEKEIEMIETTSKEAIKLDSIFNEKIKSLKTKIENQQNEKIIEERKACELIEKLEVFNKDLPFLIENLEYKRKQLEKLNQSFEIENNKVLCYTENLQKEKIKLETDINKFKFQYNSIKMEIDSYYKVIKEQKEANDDNEKEKEKLVEQIDQLSNKGQEINRKKFKLEEELKEIKLSLKKMDNEVLFKKEKINEYLKSLSYQRTILNDQEKENRKLENISKMHFAIMESMRNGTLQGIIGRLGDLGAIDPELDCAVSSASSFFDHFVVKTVQNGQQLIDFIRKNQLGKINIIVLEKISEVPLKVFEPPTSKCLRLFDQIKFLNPEARKCFYLALKDTLVADSLEDCRKIAFGLQERWRVVCKTGEVFNQSGEMIGHSRPITGKLKLNNEINRKTSNLSKELNQSKIRELIELKQSEESSLDSIKSEISVLNLKSSALEKEIFSLSNDQNIISEKIQSMEIRLSILNNRKSNTINPESFNPNLILEKEKSLQKHEKFLDLKKDELKKIEFDIEAAAGLHYAELKKNIEDLNKKEEENENEVSKAKQKIIQAEKDLEKNKEKIKKINENLEILVRSKENVVNDKTRNEKLALEKAQKFDELKMILNEKKSELDLLKKERLRVETKLAKLHLEINSELQKQQSLDKEIECIKDQSSALNEQIKKNRDKFKEDIFPLINDPVLNLKSDLVNSRQIEEMLDDPNKDYSEDEIKYMLNNLNLIEDQEKVIKNSLQSIVCDLTVLDKFKARVKDLECKNQKLAECRQREKEKKDIYTTLKSERLNTFTKGFYEISSCLKEIYRLITGGGDADLEFADSTDPFSEGIVFTVRPPSKAWKKMTNLSGGEKTLSSLALVFALHTYKPNSLYVMDEVDAALDFMNVGIVAHYIKKKTKNAQFVVVSLRYQMFELADQLVGVYKVSGVSGTLCISPYVFLGKDNSNRIIKQTTDNLLIGV